MFKNKKSLIFMVCVFAAGIVFLVKGITNFGIMDVQLSSTYMMFFYTGLGLMAVFTSLSGIGITMMLLGNQKFTSHWLEKLLDWLKTPWLKWSFNLGLIILGFFAGQLLLQTPIVENSLAKTFLIINQPFLLWIVFICLLSLFFHL